MRALDRSTLNRCAAAVLAAYLVLAAGVAESRIDDSAASLYVAINDEHVTVQAEAVSLRALLQEVARQAGFQLIMPEELDESITLEFEQRRLPEAIRSILRHHNHVLQSGPPGPAVLWVFDAHASVPEADAVSPVHAVPESPEAGSAAHDLVDADAAVRLQAVLMLADDESELATQALAGGLVDADAAVREEAVDALAGRDDPAALGLLEFALMDPDRDVREAAIEAVAEIGGDHAASVLAPLLQDADTRLRTEAVDALGEIGGATATALLRQALSDQDADIRDIAAGYLGTLSGVEPQDGMQRLVNGR